MTELVRLCRFPFPYQAAFALASDIDSASILRFRAIHALFSETGVIRPGSAEWETLGLSKQSRWYDEDLGGVAGLGLEVADSFFLIGDATTFGMYREQVGQNTFLEDRQHGENCAVLIRDWIKTGRIDCYHAFLHYTRAQVEPLLKQFYSWCEREGVTKPILWANHSAGVTPTGICPDALQPSHLRRLAGLVARRIAGPIFGRRRHPLRQAFVRYKGDSPGSRYYINDILAANGLRYVWLNYGDLRRNQICLPLKEQGGRPSILEPVRMDDGICYYRFDRCYGWPSRARAEGMYLADSDHGHDTSQLITENNLLELTERGGTCILETHWTHPWSLPVPDETIGRFRLLRQWRDAGKVWVAKTSRLLEWSRQQTFLQYSCSKQGRMLVVEITGIEDPLFGHQRLKLKDLHRVCFRLEDPQKPVRFAMNSTVLEESQVQFSGDLVWLNTDPKAAEPQPESALTMSQPT